MNKNIKLSIRNLVEFVMRSGDIDNSFKSMSRALEGTRAHQKVQNSYGDNYKKEVSLRHNIEYEDYYIQLQGRADGILTLEDEIYIDEIKSTTRNLKDIDEDYYPIHWAQAKLYGYIYCVNEDLDYINIQLTYFHIDTEEKKIFRKHSGKEELKEFTMDIIEKYVHWASTTFYWGETRDNSIKNLEFPFDDYRKGQRELAVATYKTIVQGKKLFAKAPTGIGKTISTLFPALKSVGEGFASKIFYLTAKTISRQAPLDAMLLMRKKDLRFKTVVITAKDKICINDEVKCNPVDCIYAKGHFDRVNAAIVDIFESEDLIDRETALIYANKHRVCPFEFVLDVSLWADLIIGDYNYVFDPQVNLKRFFETIDRDYVFLVDEAHNLVDRSREMFSAEINKDSFREMEEIFKEKHLKIYRPINKVKNELENLKSLVGSKNEYYQKDEIAGLYRPIEKIITQLEKFLIEEKSHEEYDSIIDFYFQLISFIKISDYYDEHYVAYIKEVDGDIIFKLYCVNSSHLLREAMYRARSSILFSATLSPIDYYMDLLGGDKEDYHIILGSPFPRKNMCLLLGDRVSTKYRDRENTYGDVVNYIKEFIHGKKGNHFIFFPSYRYMETVYEMISEEDRDLNIIIQERGMSEVDREDFLHKFYMEDDIIAFTVMGGIFSEGIDLTGDKLIGVIIVGVGMPMICLERDIIKDYFNARGNKGFEYAYTYPGMNKVLQAAGRVIRSPEDRGAILLIDSRYANRKYKALFPREWKDNRSIKNEIDLKNTLNKFWNKEE